MEKVLAWKQLFLRWPDTIPKQGIVVTNLNDIVTFCTFQVSELAVLLERDRPDTMGARSVIVPWEEIATVKLTAPIDPVLFQGMGFRPVGKST